LRCDIDFIQWTLADVFGIEHMESV